MVSSPSSFILPCSPFFRYCWSSSTGTLYAVTQIYATYYAKGEALTEEGNWEGAIDAYAHAEEYLDAEEKVLETKYEYACALMLSDNKQKAQDIFIELSKSSYKDAYEKAYKPYYDLGIEERSTGNWDLAIIAFNQAAEYNDAKEQLIITYYQKGLSQINNKDWKNAIISLSYAQKYKDASELLVEANYEYAVECFEAQDFVTAYQSFISLGNYKDAAEYISKIGKIDETTQNVSIEKRYLPRLSAVGSIGTMSSTDNVYSDGSLNESFIREVSYISPDPDDYSLYPAGILTFRGDNFRRNAAYGTADIQSETMTVLWESPIGSLRTEDNGTLYGVGWTGQPAVIHWTKEVRLGLGLYDEKKEKVLNEVIFGAQDGKIYFLDLTDGSATRDPINVGYPMKGSVSVDCMGRPLLSVGQGISKLANGKTGSIGTRLFNLVTNKEVYLLNGRKSNTQVQYNTNGAFDGTSLFLCDQEGVNAMIVAGENGLLYAVDLNMKFEYPNSDFPERAVSIEIKPDITYLRTKSGSEKEASVGVESSVAMYDKYIYMTDTYGIVRCVDSDTMKTVWAVDGGDNIDASPALDFDVNGALSLYVGNTCYNRLGNKNPVTIRRLNALTGEEIWRYEIKCSSDKNQLSGCKASPVIGQNAIENLVIFTVNKLEGGGSKILALDKNSGQVIWEKALTDEAVSSPVAVYDARGEAWIIQGDEGGNLTMLYGRTGEVRSTLNLGGAIQGSPAVYKSYLVVGTCSKSNASMYCVKIE